MPYYLLLPLAAAILYTLSSMLVKRGFEEGARTAPTFHLANLMGALLFSPLFFVGRAAVPWTLIYQPLAVGILIYVGGWFTFLAVHKGDVSLITPLLGTKVIIVAVAAFVITGTAETWKLWTAAGLTALGIFVMGARNIRRQRNLLSPILLALASAVAFGISDVLLQKWAGAFGGFRFLALMTATLALFTGIQCALQGINPFDIPAASRKWVVSSNGLLGLQAMMMALALAFFGDATGVNVVYGSRGLWSIVLVWLLGGFFDSAERKSPERVLLPRLAGAVLLAVAIVLAVAERS